MKRLQLTTQSARAVGGRGRMMHCAGCGKGPMPQSTWTKHARTCEATQERRQQTAEAQQRMPKRPRQEPGMDDGPVPAASGDPGLPVGDDNQALDSESGVPELPPHIAGDITQGLAQRSAECRPGQNAPGGQQGWAGGTCGESGQKELGGGSQPQSQQSVDQDDLTPSMPHGAHAALHEDADGSFAGGGEPPDDEPSGSSNSDSGSGSLPSDEEEPLSEVEGQGSDDEEDDGSEGSETEDDDQWANYNAERERTASAAWRYDRKDQPVYNIEDARVRCPLTAEQATFLVMDWRKCHKLKTEAINELFRMLSEVLLPQPNLFPPSLYHARRMMGYDSTACTLLASVMAAP